MEASKVWQDVLELLQKKIAAVGYEIWIKSLRPHAVKNNTLILISPLKNNKKVVESTYRDAILECIREVDAFITNFTVLLEDESPLAEKTDDAETAAKKSSIDVAEDVLIFNKAYTFDNFVIGSSNQIAYHAAKAVAEHPGGSMHNPLFIYGGVGLGKTHIIQAIGNYVAKRSPVSRILYITTNRFVDDFVDSLRDNNDREASKQFRMKYRQNLDILMIDDIQFFDNKGASQDALFNTFNDLYQHGKQIVFTSDRHPKDIKGINERLISRFQSGLTVDISKPDLETRIAILKRKALERKFVLPENVAEFVAEKIDSNIRELEGALSKIIFYCSLVDKKADNLEIVKEALKDYLDPSGNEISMDSISSVVADYFNITKSELIGKKKTKIIAEPRQIAIYIINELLSPPLTSIGEFFGGRDHTTVMYARDKVGGLIKEDASLERKVNDIRNIVLKK